jgi:hypothetical protein
MQQDAGALPASAQKEVLYKRVRVGDDLARRTVDDDAFVGYDGDAGAEFKQGVKVVGDHDHSQPEFALY